MSARATDPEGRPAARLRFALVTSAHVANNPRLVKEADALVAEGHDVRVIAPLQHRSLAERDDALVARGGWRLSRVNISRTDAHGRWSWLRDAILQKAASVLVRKGLHQRAILDHAMSRHWRSLLQEVLREPADVVVGHTVQALPVAARAAARLDARLVFDIEDLHTGELADAPENDPQRHLIAAVERRYLGQCDLLLASSEGIADAIVDDYAVKRPRVILNVFPLAERNHPVACEDERPPHARVSLYWYSQVVGPGRGIEEALPALATLPRDVHLVLRGAQDDRFAVWIGQEVERLNLRGRVHLRPTVAPEELVARAACHDVGLALEQPHTRNRDLCVTNKIFTYLLAGLAIAATETTGQRAVMSAAEGAGFLCAPGDADSLARGLRKLVEAPGAIAAAGARAREAAELRFNWDRESARLTAYLIGAATRIDPHIADRCAGS